MPDQAAIDTAYQELEAAEIELADLQPEYSDGLDWLAHVLDEFGPGREDSVHLASALGTLVGMAPDSILADPPPGHLEPMMDGLLSLQERLKELLSLYQAAAESLGECLIESLDGQRSLQTALDPAADPDERRNKLDSALSLAQVTGERLEETLHLVNELVAIATEHHERLAEAFDALRAEMGSGHLVDLLDETMFHSERLALLCPELAIRMTDLATELQGNHQRLLAVSAAAARLESARTTLAALTSAPAAGIGSLSTAWPLVLFPVRLETRFDEFTLRVRIYPDTIAADTHDERLTADELTAGQAYWQQLWPIPLSGPGRRPDEEGREAEQAAWRGLLAHFSAARAAWIVRATEPENSDMRGIEPPRFPATPMRQQQWGHGAQSTILPDHWVALAFRNGQLIHRETSNPVRRPLALSPQPANIDSASAPAGLRDTGDPVAWMFDYQEALDAGMAINISLSQEDRDEGFRHLIVYGVSASLQPVDSQHRLQELLIGHHHSQGLEFVAQGTPTNNTSASAAGYPTVDTDGEKSFAVEQAERSLRSDSDAWRLARALGIHPNVLERIEGAERRSNHGSEAMNSALWTVTLGYYLTQMMSSVLGWYSRSLDIPTLPKTATEEARQHFVDHVHGRGPLPAFRVGWTPYGVLPITSLKRWQKRFGSVDLVEQHLPTVLNSLLPVWQDQIKAIPKTGRHPGDPDRDLLEILGMDASAREVRVRRALGEDFVGRMVTGGYLDPTDLIAARDSVANQMVTIGNPSFWHPGVLDLIFDEKAYRFRNRLVDSKPVSEQERLPFERNYIRGIQGAGWLELRRGLTSGAMPPQPLLYFVLRHAALREITIQAWKAMQGAEIDPYSATPEEKSLFQKARARESDILLRDRELHGIDNDPEEWWTVWDVLEQAVPLKLDLSVKIFDQALEVLKSQPTAELERLFTETLDVCSHRLDAWVTSLAAKRLEEMRASDPRGCHLGAFGWVEELRPDPASSYGTLTMPDGSTVRGQIDRDGYVHAPSMDHAAAAAVLRSAYLTAGGPGQQRYAVDLSSRRARNALELLEGIQQGQPLAALLGYRLERGLHERRLDQFIQPLRDLYPLVAGKPVLGRKDDEGGPASAIAARNVVDGLALRKAYRERTLRLPSGLSQSQITAELEALDDAVDAIADLMLSESVYQGVRGNMSAAAASLDSLARGVRPPDPEVVDQPRGGTPLTHRVAVILGGEPILAEAWRTIPPTPRALAEPYVDGWAGRLLGNPERVLCRVFELEPETGLADPGTESIVSLLELQLCPLDLMALAEGLHTEAASSELDHRIVACVMARSGDVEQDPPALAIEYTRSDDWSRAEVCTFPEILELAAALNAVIGSARPLRGQDLEEPELAGFSQGADIDVEDGARRSGEVRELLQLAIDELEAADLANMRLKLHRASLFGLPSAVEPVSYEKLPALAEATLAILNERQELAEAAGDDPAAILAAVLGGPVSFLPRFWLSDPQRLDMARQRGPDLVAGEPNAVHRWLHEAAMARPALQLWRRLDQYRRALADLESRSGAAVFDLAQMPPDAHDTWAALPFEEQPPPGGLLSLVLHQPSRPPVDMPWVGLLLDEWVEVIPNESEVTGLAFHYDRPGTEAPQSVLIAVPPENVPFWAEDTLVDCLLETLELAQIRLVDSDLLGEVSQLLPAILLAENFEGEIIGTDFTNLVVDDPVVA